MDKMPPSTKNNTPTQIQIVKELNQILVVQELFLIVLTSPMAMYKSPNTVECIAASVFQITPFGFYNFLSQSFLHPKILL